MWVSDVGGWVTTADAADLAQLLLEGVGHLDRISLDALGTERDLVVGLREG